MKRILLALLIVAACCIPLVSAVPYTMMEDISYVTSTGASCVPNNNGTVVNMSYDDDEDTFYQTTDCRIQAYYKHNWTAAYCSAIYTVGPATQTFSVWNSNATGSGNTSTLSKGVLGSLMLKSGATTYYPYIPAGGWTAVSDYTTPGSTMRISEWTCYGESVDVPMSVTADFTGDPLNGTSRYVTFVDNSTGYPLPTSWNWSYSPTAGVYVAPGDLDNQNIVMLFTQDGNYTITHCVSNGDASDCEVKTDYIRVYNASSNANIRVRAIDALVGGAIHNATINVYDVTGNNWTNQTGALGEVAVTMLSGHTFEAYASAEGYDDNDITGQTAIDGELYAVSLWPQSMPSNVTEGNITLYVSTLEYGTTTKVSGITVNIAYGSPQHNNYGTTNSNGLATFSPIPNQTTVYIHVEAQKGYKAASATVNTGTGSGGSDYVDKFIYLEKDVITPTATVTTLPGGGTPTPTTTVDPYPCDADHPENCKRKQTDMANILVEYGPMLVMFFIALTIIGGVKQIGR